MHVKRKAHYEAEARIVKALAHPTRLFIVDELASCGEKCVCELTEMIGADMSTVSRHLATLNAAGIIADEKRGQKIYYRLRERQIQSLLECIDSCRGPG